MAFSAQRAILGASGTPSGAGGSGDIGLLCGGDNRSADPDEYTNMIQVISISSTGDATDWSADLDLARGATGTMSNGTRGVCAGGATNLGGSYGGRQTKMDYITFSSAANATDFGDLLANAHFGTGAGASNGSSDRGIISGFNRHGAGARDDRIEYITISSTANATHFGNMTHNRTTGANTSNGTSDRGISAGGYSDDDPYWHNVIDYITISSTGDATDFGDLSVARQNSAGMSNLTNERGVVGAGNHPRSTTIDYITINSTANATDFGDTSTDKNSATGLSSGTDERGVMAGGYDAGGGTGGTMDVIEYITINSTANVTDFGDMLFDGQSVGGMSNAG